MTINITDLLASLEMMWKGMVGLFAVCGFVMLLTMLFSRIMIGKGKKEI